MQSIFGKISRAVARAPVNIQDGELHDNDVVNLSILDAYEGPAYAFEHVAEIFQTIFLRCLVLLRAHVTSISVRCQYGSWCNYMELLFKDFLLKDFITLRYKKWK